MKSLYNQIRFEARYLGRGRQLTRRLRVLGREMHTNGIIEARSLNKKSDRVIKGFIHRMLLRTHSLVNNTQSP